MGPPSGWSEDHQGDSANTGAKTLSLFSLRILSALCKIYIQKKQRKKKRNPLWFKAPNIFPVIITLIGIYFKMSLTLNPYCYEQKTDLCLCFLLCSLAMRREKKKKIMKPQLNSKQTLGPALPLCLSASLCDLWAAEVNGSHVLIVLWSRHGALAPRRVRLTKVKSAGSIKAHLRVAEPPPPTPHRLAAGLWEGLIHTRLFTATNNNKVTDNLTEKQEF